MPAELYLHDSVTNTFRKAAPIRVRPADDGGGGGGGTLAGSQHTPTLSLARLGRLPTKADCGPRVALADNAATQVSGYNTQNGATITGQRYTAKLEVYPGGPNNLQTVTFVDCEFVGGLLVYAPAVPHLVACSGKGSISFQRGGVMERSLIETFGGDAMGVQRFDNSTTAATTDYSTPGGIFDSYLEATMDPASSNHLDVIQVRGARDFVIDGNVLDVPGGFHAQKNGALFLERDQGGTSFITVRNNRFHAGSYYLCSQHADDSLWENNVFDLTDATAPWYYQQADEDANNGKRVGERCVYTNNVDHLGNSVGVPGMAA